MRPFPLVRHTLVPSLRARPSFGSAITSCHACQDRVSSTIDDAPAHASSAPSREAAAPSRLDYDPSVPLSSPAFQLAHEDLTREPFMPSSLSYRDRHFHFKLRGFANCGACCACDRSLTSGRNCLVGSQWSSRPAGSGACCLAPHTRSAG